MHFGPCSRFRLRHLFLRSLGALVYSEFCGVLVLTALRSLLLSHRWCWAVWPLAPRDSGQRRGSAWVWESQKRGWSQGLNYTSDQRRGIEDKSRRGRNLLVSPALLSLLLSSGLFCDPQRVLTGSGVLTKLSGRLSFLGIVVQSQFKVAVWALGLLGVVVPSLQKAALVDPNHSGYCGPNFWSWHLWRSLLSFFGPSFLHSRHRGGSREL